jgi:hypothetical protein
MTDKWSLKDEQRAAMGLGEYDPYPQIPDPVELMKVHGKKTVRPLDKAEKSE